MKWSVLVAVVLILTMLLGCSPKAPVPLSPTQEAPPPAAPQETPAPSPITYTLTVTAAPSNGGSINLSPAGGTYTSGITVTLTATPASGYTFDYWDGAASGSSYTVTIIMNSNKSTTAHFKAAPAPTTTPTPSPTPTGPYTGPLFDTHLHIYHMYSGTTPYSGTPAKLLSYLDRNKVEGAIGFYYFTKDKSMSFVSAAEAIIRGTRSRVIPLLQPEGNGWTQFTSGQYNEAVLRQYLQPQGLLQGVGEIPLYWAETQSVTFDSPVMQTVFQVVNEKKGIVMIHPRNPRQAPPTELAEIERSVQKYPDAIFLFHSDIDNLKLVVQLMPKYPNVYFTMDATHSIFYQGFNPLMGYNFLYPEGGDKPSHGNAESFLADVNRIGSDRLVEQSFAKVAPLIKQYPDRIMWGTDLSTSWHFEGSVTDMVIKISREFIGRLPADVQEKYAYKNAQKVFGRFLTPNP